MASFDPVTDSDSETNEEEVRVETLDRCGFERNDLYADDTAQLRIVVWVPGP